MSIAAFLQLAADNNVDMLRTNQGRLYEARDIRRLAMKLAALARDDKTRDQFRAAVRLLRP
jgi:hypothetical protein